MAKQGEVPHDSGKTGAESSLEGKFPIVGIGGSAGGLEAFTALLTALPPDLGMSYVVVPHLDPSRTSTLAEILGRATSMPVVDAEEGMVVKPNRVYIIPRDREMSISHRVLHLAQRDHPRSVNTAVDIFMRSLAADQGSNAIGVILSGTASDGTLGVGAIKGEGGITFAQDSTAKYDGMPASAIAAGSVDFVLPPDGIANELKRIARHPYVRGQAAELQEVGENKQAQMAQVFALLRRATRVDFSEYKPPTVARRIARRMALHRIEELRDFVALLQRDRNEVKALYHDLLINVTSFFRNPEAFEALKAIAYPELLARRTGNSPLRIWVPGCSTGEEAYSHAITLLEFLGEERSDIPVQIFATDLSETAVQRARVGIYKEAVEADVSPIRLRRFFRRVDSGYQVSKTIRDFCIFSTQNVVTDPPFSRIDLISCRNVMIYLGHALQRRVMPVFHYALNAGGFLLVGNTEGLVGTGSELFEIADRKQKIYRKKAVATPTEFGFLAQSAQARPDGGSAAGTAGTARVPGDITREADRLLLARYAPPCVVVDEQLDIVQAKGDTAGFFQLPTGKTSLNLLKMARPGLLHELQNAIQEARQSGQVVTRTDVPVEDHGTVTATKIRITPFKAPLHDEFSFLITFESAAVAQLEQALEPAPSPLTDEERTLKDRQIAQLRQELTATKEYMQSIIEELESANEELQSANEEIQSGNEELQSTNEELQTSKEELESANEELHTVNEEMQNRNEQLTHLNNDLTNILDSVNLPLAMVGPDLALRRMTASAATVLGLAPSDIGRPITRLRLNIEVDDFEHMLLDVMSKVRPLQQKVRCPGHRSCELRLSPYRTIDNRIDGVVLRILGIDDLGDGVHEGVARSKARATGLRRSGKTGKRK